MMKEEYSIVVVFKPNLDSQDEAVERVVTWLKEIGAKVVAQNHLGIKDLVYQIKGNSKGDFWEMSLESTKPLKLRDFNLYLNREVSVIRYLVLKK